MLMPETILPKYSMCPAPHFRVSNNEAEMWGKNHIHTGKCPLLWGVWEAANSLTAGLKSVREALRTGAQDEAGL